jgi:UDP-N-acetylglucosamine--N-acetylmuramyl-(pentapeptide) pyrophosphoryl-undecaprenol N-acetylglucosamine transferase
VLREIKAQYPDTEIRFWCDRKFESQARRVMGHFDESIRVDVVVSGKLRRYHHLTLFQQLLRFRAIVWPNLVDGIKVLIGTVQSLVKLIVWRPDVVFTKGGFVCLPIGFAAHTLRRPLVIHDSDAHPGLTNRILARWATGIGTGAPLKFYPYPSAISRYVGVPVMAEFSPFDDKKRSAVKASLGFDPARPLIVVTGGGLGAQRLNMAVANTLHELMKRTNVILISGEGQYDEMRTLTPQDDERYQLHAFVSKGMADMLGAADVVVARAGATTILELAALAKPTILVPNGFLTGGHQLKNAAVYAEKGAVSVIDELELEKRPDMLVDEVVNILADDTRRDRMSVAFHEFAKPYAARDMANLIVSAVKK